MIQFTKTIKKSLPDLTSPLTVEEIRKLAKKDYFTIGESYYKKMERKATYTVDLHSVEQLNSKAKRFQVSAFADPKVIKTSLHDIVGNLNGLSQAATLALAKKIDHATLRIADWAAANALAGGEFTQGDLLQFNSAVNLLVDVADLEREDAVTTLIAKKPELAAIAQFFTDCAKKELTLDYTGDKLPEPSWYSGKPEGDE
jgi:hypothetical protein